MKPRESNAPLSSKRLEVLPKVEGNVKLLSGWYFSGSCGFDAKN
jgi:hypothetical protein